jgi:hypothetical protein
MEYLNLDLFLIIGSFALGWIVGHVGITQIVTDIKADIATIKTNTTPTPVTVTPVPPAPVASVHVV